MKTIIVCGHYNCGAVKAALTSPHNTPSLVNCWIADIRECREAAAEELQGLGPEEALDRWVGVCGWVCGWLCAGVGGGEAL